MRRGTDGYRNSASDEFLQARSAPSQEAGSVTGTRLQTAEGSGEGERNGWRLTNVKKSRPNGKASVDRARTSSQVGPSLVEIKSSKRVRHKSVGKPGGLLFLADLDKLTDGMDVLGLELGFSSSGVEEQTESLGNLGRPCLCW